MRLRHRQDGSGAGQFEVRHGARFARGEFGSSAPSGRHGGHEGRQRHFGRGRQARTLEHGDLRMLVLHLINEKPCHGYEIIKAIEDLAGGGYAPSPGVIYPTLTALEEAGQISSVTEGARKRFSITEAGVEAVNADLAAVKVILGRIAASQAREPAPPVVRAMENLKTSLRLKLGAGVVSAETTRKIADLLDAAARAVEES